jgi:glycolate oxidase
MDLYKVVSDILGPENVSELDFERWCYSEDASPEPWRMPEIVVKPRSTEEIVELVRIANRTKTPIWPRGGGTGLGGLGYPISSGGIVLDMLHMNKIIEINEDTMTVTAQAGTICNTLNDKLEDRGYRLVIPGHNAGLSATIGGGIATGTYGLNSAQYGAFCEQIICLEVVMPDGQVIHTGSASNVAAEKFNRYVNGPDLAGLFCDSHGIFGIITEATLKIMLLPEAVDYVTGVFPSIEALEKALHKINQERLIVENGSLAGRRTVKALTHPQIDAEAVSRMIIEGRKEEVKCRKEAVVKIIEEHGGYDLGPDTCKYGYERRFWRVPSSIKHGGFAAMCNRIPSSRFGHIIEKAETFFYTKNKQVMERYGIEAFFFPSFGYGTVSLADGMYWDRADPDATKAATELWREWLETSVAEGGCPYWIGTAWSRVLMPRIQSANISVLKTLKATLDPNNILNPGMFQL